MLIYFFIYPPVHHHEESLSNFPSHQGVLEIFPNKGLILDLLPGRCINNWCNRLFNENSPYGKTEYSLGTTEAKEMTFSPMTVIADNDKLWETWHFQFCHSWSQDSYTMRSIRYQYVRSRSHHAGNLHILDAEHCMDHVDEVNWRSTKLQIIVIWIWYKIVNKWPSIGQLLIHDNQWWLQSHHGHKRC